MSLDNDASPPFRPSLRDIAKIVGLSHVAVSLALRDSPRISLEKRQAVKVAAEKLGYRPDPMLASLAAYRQGKRGSSIRACLAWINQWPDAEALRNFKEFDRYWLGAQEAAERLGYHLEEFRWSLGKSGRRLQTILETRGVCGLIIPPHGTGMDLPEFDWSRFSIVRFGASVQNLPAHSITSDQSHCSRLAYEKAIEYGYRRIAYLSDERFEQNTRGHFREGFLNAQEEMSPTSRRLKTLVFPAESKQRTAEFVRWCKSQKPDAIISTMTGIRPLLDAAGLKVPEDIGVATTSVLDGHFDAGADQNSHEIGRVAVSTLAGLILENERGLPRYQRRILVQGRWVDGSSLPNRVGTVTAHRSL